MKILSFDCADKTLGICEIEVDDFYEDKLEDVKLDKEGQEKLSEILCNHVILVNAWIVDILPDQKVREVSSTMRLGRLKKILFDLPKPDVVIVEHQMSKNDLSRSIQDGIVSFYQPMLSGANITALKIPNKSSHINKLFPKVYILKPTWKNTISFSKELEYCEFTKKYKTQKSINKRHAYENMMFFLKTFKQELNVNYTKGNHIADAFMQAYYWIVNLS
jgi:hypothetical protein